MSTIEQMSSADAQWAPPTAVDGHPELPSAVTPDAVALAVAPEEVASAVPPGTLRAFHPGWFSVVMGTVIVGVAAYMNPGNVSSTLTAAHDVGVAFVLLAAALAVLIAVPYLLRLVHHGDAALTDLHDPVIGAMYATLPAALLVLAVGFATVGKTIMSAHAVFVLVAVMTAVGAPLAFASGVLFAYSLFAHEHITSESANGGWFIPPVVAIIIPLTLIPLLPHVGPAAGRLLLLTSYGAFGIGLLLFLLLTAVVFFRLIFHPLPPAALAPTLVIGLGPIGVGAIALLRLAAAGHPYWGASAGVVQIFSQVSATALWGLGVWWLVTAAALLVRYLRRGGLPYGVGLWGFTFPLGAYAVATLELARVWQDTTLEWVGAALSLGLLLIWLLVAVRTLNAIRTGTAWQR